MLSFCIRRLVGLIPLGAGIIALVALLIHAVPGDPVDSIASPYATAAEKDKLRSDMGLDRPVIEQIGHYYKQILSGSLGTSIIYQKPITELISERWRPTMELAACALLVSTLISIPIGVFSAVHAGRAFDFIAMTTSLLGVSIPTFCLGPLLVLLFALKLDWLPVSERGDWTTYILPSLTMGTALAGVLSRMTRTSMLDTMKEDYVRTARAKGNTEWVVICKHVLRNAALPLVTIIGLQFGVLLTGAIITERIFDWPGLGSLIVEGINNRDYPLVQGCVLVFSATYLIVNLFTDLMYAFVDPRIKLEK